MFCLSYGLRISYVVNNQGPVVQSWFSINPGLKFNPLFYFVYLNASFLLKLEKRKLQSIQAIFI